MKIDDLGEIKILIAQAENKQVEFKETTGRLEHGMETLCAFLNGEGGTVLFGVTNPGVFSYDWDIEKMKSVYCSEFRNSLITNVLCKRKLLENWGRGTILSTTQIPHKHRLSIIQVDSLLNRVVNNTYLEVLNRSIA